MRLMRNLAFSVAALGLLSMPAQAALMLMPLDSFGGGDGWLAPAEASYLSGANVQRGMTYNELNNHIYLVDRNGGNFIRVLDGNTGALISSLDTTGITGGTFLVNMVDVAADGTIYVGNLSTSSTSNFKIYRWANEAAVPTVAFNGPANRIRTGDTLAVVGSGLSTRIVAAGGSNAGETYALFTTGDGLTYTVSNPAATGAANGAFRLGIDFAGPDVVLGQQSSNALTENPTFGGTATVHSTLDAPEAPLAWDPVQNLLATVDIASNAVRLYDGSDLTALTTTGFLDIENLTTSFVANGNGVGDLKFGRTALGELRLYVLNTNNGIQAFRVVPEPASTLLVLLGGLGLAALRRR